MTTETERPFDAGKWFAIHNAIFDVIMPSLSPNGWKVLCVAIRQTWGWRDPSSNDPRQRKEWDHIPYSQFRDRSGIASDATVKRALDECIEPGYLLRRQPTDKEGNPRLVRGKPYYEYSLNRDYELTATESVEVEGVTTTESVEVTATESVEVEAPMATETVEPKHSINTTTKHADAAASLTKRQRQALDALLAVGFQPTSDAERYACKVPEAALGWALYAQREGLGGGFVRQRLNAGDPVPTAPTTTTTPPPAPAGVFT